MEGVDALPAATLGLAGDGDEATLLRAVEESFGIRFGDETGTWFTVGDVFKSLLAHLPPSNRAGSCATMMAFHGLRATLLGMGVARSRIEPAARLAGLTGLPPKRLFTALSKTLGINRVPVTLSWWGCSGVAGLLTGLAGIPLAVIAHTAWPLLLLMPAGVAMIQTDAGRYGRLTVGDLAQRVASANFSRFAGSGADQRSSAMWDALCRIIADHAAVQPGTVAPGTRLLS